MGYFGFYSFYMLGGCNGVAGESSSSGICDVRGGVTPRKGFLGVYWDLSNASYVFSFWT